MTLTPEAYELLCNPTPVIKYYFLTPDRVNTSQKVVHVKSYRTLKNY